MFSQTASLMDIRKTYDWGVFRGNIEGALKTVDLEKI
jgi:hypothetical protein